jgi:hypothetical protein
MSTYTPIASQTLGSTSSNVTFSSIPQGYTDLVLVVQAKAATTGDNIYLRFNSDDSSNYSVTNMYGNGSTAASTRYSTSYIWFDNFGYLRTSDFSTIVMNFQNYSNSTTNKTCLIRNNITSVGVIASVGLWRNTTPITAINLLTSGFASGSTFSLYGIQVGDKAQKAQGGNIVTTDGTYVYHTFTSSGSFTPNTALTADYLVVAGGGGGASNIGGGGGAGGYRTSIGGTALSLIAQSYPVIIGAGGSGGLYVSGQQDGAKGTNSVFSTITSTGGGLGDGNGGNGGTGGSGGGGDRNSNGGAGNQGSYSPAEGTTGGNGGGGSTGAGGGGGATSSGSNGSGTNGGNGGAGTANSISGSSVTYAGGGGGGSWVSGGTGGTGGAGGGGTGASNTGGGTNGTTNLGSGGGGGIDNAGGNGGSGVVIIRYAI